VAVIGSVDSPHRLARSSPAGYSPYGKKFDDKSWRSCRKRKPSAFVTFEPQLAEKAAQCALASLTILSGIMDGIEAAPEILSYESPFGIGYSHGQLYISHEHGRQSAASSRSARARRPIRGFIRGARLGRGDEHLF